MKPTSGKVGYSRTIRVADYESVRIEAEQWYDLEPGDDADAVRRAAFEALKAEARAQALPILTMRQKKLRVLADPAVARFVERAPGDVSAAFQELLDLLYQDAEEASNGHKGA